MVARQLKYQSKVTYQLNQTLSFVYASKLTTFYYDVKGKVFVANNPNDDM